MSFLNVKSTKFIGAFGLLITIIATMQVPNTRIGYLGEVSTLGTLGNLDEDIQDIVTHENFAYTAHSSGHITIIDITNHENPHILGQWWNVTAECNFSKIQYLDSIVILLDQSKGITFLNVSDHNNPEQIISFTDLSGFFLDFIIHDYKCILFSRNNGYFVFVS